VTVAQILAVTLSCGDNDGVSLAVLEHDMYSEVDAARHLQLAPSTLHYWLEGGTRRGKTYLPVIRERATGARSVTWGEFVEAGLLRQYRRVHNVPMHELRAVIDILRQRLQVPYPLAHARPFVGDRKLLEYAQEKSQLAPDFCLVAIAGGQLVLTGAAEEFVSRVDWTKDDLPTGWRPHSDAQSPIRMRPDTRFGLPSVDGIRTEVIWEHLDAGESVAEVADTFDISERSVRWADSYESALRASSAKAS
jgi:uncharacterized protein (DUF433 family)